MLIPKTFPNRPNSKRVYIVLKQFVFDYGGAGVTRVSAVYDDIDKACDRCKALREDGYLVWIDTQYINDEGD